MRNREFPNEITSPEKLHRAESQEHTKSHDESGKLLDDKRTIGGEKPEAGTEQLKKGEEQEIPLQDSADSATDPDDRPRRGNALNERSLPQPSDTPGVADDRPETPTKSDSQKRIEDLDPPKVAQLIKQIAEKIKEVLSTYVTDDIGETAMDFANKRTPDGKPLPNIGEEQRFGEDKHLSKIVATPEHIEEAIDKFLKMDNLRLLASTTKTDKSAYMPISEFVSIMKEVIKDPKDQAKLLDGINTALAAGLHSNAETKTLKKLARTFSNESKNKDSHYIKAANVVNHLLNSKTSAVRHDEGFRIVDKSGCDTRPNKETASTYRKKTSTTYLLSIDKLTQSIKEKGFLGGVREALSSPLPPDVKQSSSKLRDLEFNHVRSQSVGNFDGKKDNTGYSGEGSAVAHAVTDCARIKNLSGFISRKVDLLPFSFDINTKDAPKARIQFSNDSSVIGIKTANHIIGLKINVSVEIPNIFNKRTNPAESPTIPEKGTKPTESPNTPEKGTKPAESPNTPEKGTKPAEEANSGDGSKPLIQFVYKKLN